MNEPARIGYPKARLVRADMKGFDALAELALDVRSSWNHAAELAGKVDRILLKRVQRTAMHARGPAGVYAVATEAAPA